MHGFLDSPLLSIGEFVHVTGHASRKRSNACEICCSYPATAIDQCQPITSIITAILVLYQEDIISNSSTSIYLFDTWTATLIPRVLILTLDGWDKFRGVA